jgi:tripartite-type tricarboxylate transporter receptor subunit TctC
MLRIIAGALLAGFVALQAANPASAQDWPKQPIHWIVPFPPGGQAEVAARIIAEKLSVLLGQPVLVEAKPGANGNLGAQEVAKAPPDGYKWLSSGVPLSTAPAMYPTTLNINVTTDLIPVAKVGNTSFVMVVPKALPVSNFKEFVAYAKEKKGQLTYAGSGIGSLVHLGTEMFKLKAGIDMLMVPYNGQPPAVTDVLGNRVQFMVMGLALAQPLIASGDIKPLAILDAERHPNLPNVPTIAELGFPELVMGGWAGIHVPKGTPDAIVKRISDEVNKALVDKTVIDQLVKAGWTPIKPNTPAEFKEFFDKEVASWKQTVVEAKVKTN